MKLLLSQKNEIFDLIKITGLFPNQFNVVETRIRRGIETKFHYINSDYFFLFEPGIDNSLHHAVYSPGDFKFQSGVNTKHWNEDIKHFTYWLNYLKKEINAPDKWERLQSEIENLNLSFNGDENKFSASEYKDLKIKMDILKENLSKLQLLPEQIEIFESKIDHLTELALNLNKFDWKNLFIGTIISIVIQLSVTPENAKAIWDLIKGIFNNYFLP